MKIKVGIIKEEKTPPDTRAPLSPRQCAFISRKFSIDLAVQASEHRCYSNMEYRNQGVTVVNDISDREILLGVKEVPILQLMPNKTYFFFSHTIKKQPYNREMLRSIIAKDITLIDWEVLTNEDGIRLIAFGKFAGIVGAHNAIWTYGMRTGLFSLPRLHQLKDYEEAQTYYRKLKLPPVRIVLTGTGRVANGAASVLNDMKIQKLSPAEYLNGKFEQPVYTQLNEHHYIKRKNRKSFELQDFFDRPTDFESNFQEFTRNSDIMINGIYWDPRAPKFFSLLEMSDPRFRIKVIADITCDIAPEASIPSTIRPTTIQDPVFGFQSKTRKEIRPFSQEGIDVMAIDNLPNELPRGSSVAFGEQFIKGILPEILKGKSDVLGKATIASGGKLTNNFLYLTDYIGESN